MTSTTEGVHPSGSREVGSADSLKTLREWTQALAVVAVPIVLAVVGSWFTTVAKTKETNSRFVELAVEILRQKPESSGTGVRGWAADVLDKYSGVKVNDSTRRDLITNPLGLITSKALSARVDPELNARMREAFPEVSSSWGVVEVYNEEHDVSIRYLAVPLWVVETFIENRRVADSVRKNRP